MTYTSERHTEQTIWSALDARGFDPGYQEVMVTEAANGEYRNARVSITSDGNGTYLLRDIRHYTFFQPDGTCFSVAAVDAWEAKATELRFLGLRTNASYDRYSEHVDTDQKIRAALRKAARMYGSKTS